MLTDWKNSIVCALFLGFHLILKKCNERAQCPDGTTQTVGRVTRRAGVRSGEREGAGGSGERGEGLTCWSGPCGGRPLCAGTPSRSLR